MVASSFAWFFLHRFTCAGAAVSFTSPPGGNKVDGLPPAFSWEEIYAYRIIRMRVWASLHGKNDSLSSFLTQYSAYRVLRMRRRASFDRQNFGPMYGISVFFWHVPGLGVFNFSIYIFRW